ncbi:MAG: hypothetical protein Q8R56_16710 [Polaromonas sp.]|jgi:hypothetical protein|nr:hypothetical protein [Polaromonas sp.]
MNPQSRWCDGFALRRFEVNGAPIHARFLKLARAAVHCAPRS